MKNYIGEKQIFTLIKPLHPNIMETLDVDETTPKGKVIAFIKDYLYNRTKKCGLCKCKFKRRELIIDRRKPKGKGGDDQMDNLQLLCQQCKKIKGEKSMLQTRKDMRLKKKRDFDSL